MKNILIVILLGMISQQVYSQDEIADQLMDAFVAEKYDQIISEHAGKTTNYSSRAVYFIGMAYYRKADDNNALKMMELSIKKDNSNSDAHFFKGMTLNYLSQFEKAKESINKAIELDPENSEYLSGLGDVYVSLEKYNEALASYIKATETKRAVERPFMMIPQIYLELKQPEKALAAFYKAKDVISKESDDYKNALYNIGLYENLNRNYDKAEVAFLELINLAPDDFHPYAKLIQAYYGKKEYDRAAPYREKLYDAHAKGILKGNLKDMFCFDQFDWEDKLIQVFERFEEKKGELYNKHLFYVVNNENKMDFRIQTENSPISEELGGPKYAVGMDKDGVHSTFGFIKKDFEYGELKSIVISILEKEIQPGATSYKVAPKVEESGKKKKKGKKGGN